MATIKGAFVLKGDGARRSWSVGNPYFLGSETNHLVRDPRDRKTLLLAARTGPVVQRTFFLTSGHASQPGVWWAGTVPHALFRSEDGGATWEHVSQFSRYVAGLKEQKPANIGETPGGAITHSILIDPRNPSHMYVSLSTGGFFETTDAGRDWRPINGGSSADFLPEKFPEYGQDPH